MNEYAIECLELKIWGLNRAKPCCYKEKIKSIQQTISLLQNTKVVASGVVKLTGIGYVLNGKTKE